ncbi:9443_t:CDS:10 [Entrophospora sp. SA101]|nr:9443_t:CDS:10 [Entrophospora sp. SA101]
MQPVFRNIKFVELNPKTIPKLAIPCFEYVSIKLSLLKKDDTFNVYLMVLPSVEVKDDEIGLPNWIIWLPKFLKQEDSSRTNNLLLDYEEIIKRNLDGTLVSNNSLFNIKIMNNECIFIIKSIIINDDNYNKIVDNKIYKVNKNITKIEIRLNNNNINGNNQNNYWINTIPGYSKEFNELYKFIDYSFNNNEICNKLNIPKIKAILINGPKGVGKKTLVKAILSSPSIILIKDLDLLSNKVNDEDESSSDIDGGWKSRIINSLIKEIQNINETDKQTILKFFNIKLIYHFQIQREEILEFHINNLFNNNNLSNETIYEFVNKLGMMTNGYVSEDIYNLCRLTLMHSLNNQTNNDGENEDVNNIINNMSKININAGGNNKNFKIDWEDFNYGLSMMKPLGKFGTDKIPINLNLNDDIGGYEAIKKKLIKIIEFSLINNGKNDGNYNLLGVRPLTGLLLYGPSGCGKTILIQTIAKELNINLIYIKSPEIYSKYLGETEKFLRNLFKKSKQISCIIFFDEIDSIGTKRDWESNESSVGINERVLSTLLNEIDGIQELKNVLIIGCTNNPEQLDDALIRPDDRLNILKVLSRKFSLGEDVDLKKLAELTERFSGADLEKLFR